MIHAEIGANGKDHLQAFLEEWDRLKDCLPKGQVSDDPVG